MNIFIHAGATSVRRVGIAVTGLLLGLMACKGPTSSGAFTVTAAINGAANQPAVLEQLFFNNQEPLRLDSGQLINGAVQLKGDVAEEGLFRIRLLTDSVQFIFINDEKSIQLKASTRQPELQAVEVSTTVNRKLRAFVAATDSQIQRIQAQSAYIRTLPVQQKGDSLFDAAVALYDAADSRYKQSILRFIDTTPHATLALFALGYTRNIGLDSLEKSVNALPKRFPGNEVLAGLVAQFNQMMVKARQPQPTAANGIAPGTMAPDLRMPGTDGKPLSIHQFRGKYLLVDFWASWCGPCRAENPNVVKAWQQFKNRNFTILGVSLDRDKAAWLQAIKDDQLTWQHMSDLKYWNSAATSVYQIQSIPANVLIDPSGKIVATNLGGEELLQVLEVTLKP